MNMLWLVTMVKMMVIVDFVAAFECYTCNPRKGHRCVEQMPKGTRSDWSTRSSPAPPSQMAPTLLCVCTLPLCNAGHFSTVVENTMLNHLPRQLLPSREEKKVAVNSVRDHPAYGLAEQLADAGF
ncbi:hypothetical protein DICVIV_03694 [Dictyocaulus viviparus]|uniref:Secreted protein n=1 Tax=Dictyocaulus viviparus TaxID=29172 RepID=A0A0D8Y6J3_DICVI|nr:hypothetical protein DICVIV_03694 [Dictyocaulus viviparus]